MNIKMNNMQISTKEIFFEVICGVVILIYTYLYAYGLSNKIFNPENPFTYILIISSIIIFYPAILSFIGFFFRHNTKTSIEEKQSEEFDYSQSELEEIDENKDICAWCGSRNQYGATCSRCGGTLGE